MWPTCGSIVAGLGDETIPALAAAAAGRVPDRVAVTVDGEPVTHAELDDAAGRVAAWLARRVHPGDRVLLAAGASVGFVRCYLGALRAGAVVVLANPGYTAAELGHLVADSGAVLAFADPEPARRLAGLGREPEVRGNPRPGFRAAGDGGRPGPARTAMADRGIVIRPHDTALLAYTSGTTGRPKGVPLTHRQLAVSIRAAMAAWRWHSDDVLVHALPLYHQHGLGGLHAALIAGGTVHIRSKFSAADLVRAAGDSRASVLFAVPTIYQALLASPAAPAGGPALRPAPGRMRFGPAEPGAGRAAAGRARAAAAGQVRHDRERAGRLQPGRRSPRGHDRGAAARRAGQDLGRGPRPRIPARTARSRSAGRRSSRATGTTRRPPRPRSPRTAGSAPATSGPWTRPPGTW